ncbi:MAG: hypothetical protein KDD64_06710 [Bdellovibrionales bacterium]|nr:hypothetical protein [Bdellovibrionales bacterium]
MELDFLFAFISLLVLSAGLGIDNGLLIDFSLRTLHLEHKKHTFWRSVALLVAAGLRVFFLFILSKLTFLKDPLPHSNWYINRMFSEHPDELTWMNLVLFAGGLIIIFMALWEYYHKFREELSGKTTSANAGKKVSIGKVVAVIIYLIFMNILFSLDSVFAAVAIMDIETQFGWMALAIILAALIMIFGMIPLSALIAKSPHFKVLMLSVLVVISAKLMVDGTGAHFSNLLLIFILGVLMLNDAAQAAIDWADKRGMLLNNGAADSGKS